jgi:hypothetical protein
MSFEMKYDVNGTPILPKEQPKFEEPKQDEPQVTLSAETQPEVVENQADSDEQMVENQAPEQPEAPKQAAPKPAQESWKELRAKAEQAQRERDEALRLLQQIQQNQERQNTQPSHQDVEEDLSINVEEDALVEGKHLSKVNKQIKKLENQLKQYQQQAALNTTEVKLKTQYPDFDNIVTKENLENLRNTYPEIASTINASQDIYAKAVSAYTMIKKLGLAPAVDTFQDEKAQAQRNALKPKPLAAVAPSGSNDSPLNRANAFASGKLTDDLQKALLKEMQEARKGY